jgi:hypothetical protein
MEITETASKLADDLHAALMENEGLRAQIHDLQARNGQMEDRLGDLQDLVDMVKNFADDMLADNSE